MDRGYLIAELRKEREKRERLSVEVTKFDAYTRSTPGDPGVEERLHNLRTGLARSEDRIAQLEGELKRTENLERAAANPRNREAGADFGPPLHPAGHEAPERQAAVFDEAQKVLERHLADGVLRSSDADRIDGVLRGGDLHFGLDARYVAAVGQEEYASAFTKMLVYGDGAVLRMTAEEQGAVQQVVAAERLRTMAEGTGSAGGFGLPIAIDPTMVISSAGVVSPLRDLASQRTIATREYRAITTAGTTATFAAELTEVSDGSPSLSQPDFITEKAQAFIPFSIEVGMDYPNLLEELGKLLGDAKAVLEGTKFVSGAGHGSTEPLGIVTGLVAAGGSSVITTASAGTWAVADVYSAQNSLSPRWQANAVWAMSLPMFNTTHRLVASASSTEPQIVSPDGRLLLTKPWYEVSPMATSVAAGNQIAVYGAIADAFRIIDRIGMQIEVVGHLFSSANMRPTGSRALYAFWRVTSGLMVPDAARVITVHA